MKTIIIALALAFSGIVAAQAAPAPVVKKPVAVKHHVAKHKAVKHKAAKKPLKGLKPCTSASCTPLPDNGRVQNT